jgi:oligopeptide transport system permease protein
MWQPDASAANAVPDIGVIASNTEFVRLVWPQVENAARYRVYRNHRTRENTLGLPLTQLPAAQPWYQDRLNLAPRKYRYTVLADDATGVVLREFHIETRPRLAMTFYAAQLGNLVSADGVASDHEGRLVTLPAHPLGTDHLGRDVLARLLSGGRTSLFIGLAAPLVYVLLGMLYGATSALIGGRIDAVMMNFVDFVVALPFLLFMILFRVAMGTGPGESGITAMLVAMIALGWPSPARLVRGQILKLRELPYVDAARLMGAGRGYLIVRHLLPNVMGSVLVTFTFAIPSAIFSEAFLSFIGMGVVPPAASWGSMCNDGLRNLLTYPHMMLFPALAISLTVLVFNLLGDALRDAMAVHDHG